MEVTVFRPTRNEMEYGCIRLTTIVPFVIMLLVSGPDLEKIKTHSPSF